MEKRALSISVVICTKNRPKDLKECIDSVICQEHLPNEIIVIDSSDNDFTRKLIQKYEEEDNVSIQYAHAKPSLTKQRNIGITKSRGDIVAFFDDDVILDKLYLKEVIKCFKMSHDIVGVGGIITNLNRKHIFNSYFRSIFMLRSSGKKGFMKRSGFPCFYDASYIDEVVNTQILSGCNCCYRKYILDDYKFDEIFEGYGLMEDVEFSYRVSIQNKLVCTSKAKLIHKYSPLERINLKKYFEMYAFNHYYIFKKNVKKNKLDWIPFWWSDFGIFLIAIFNSIKNWNNQPLAGFYRGHLKFFKSLE